MRKRYHASFHVGQPGYDGPSVKDVSELCIAWIMKSGHAPLAHDLSIEPGATLARTSIGDQSWLETLAVTSDEAKYWGLRFIHADETDAGLEWHTEVCISTTNETKQTTFTCTNLVGSTTGSVSPTRRERSRPRIVRDVLKQWSGYRGHRLDYRPEKLDASAVKDFVNLLRSPERVRPVVLVSAANWDDRPVIDADALADWLCGLAHVFVATNRFASFKLVDYLPRRISCWDGAIRVYWPNLNFADEPYVHRLWTPSRLKDLEALRKHGFKEYLLGMLSDEAAYSTDPDAPSWVILDTIRRHQLVEEARAAGNQDDLLQLADEEIQSQQSVIRDLEDQLRDLSQELHAAEKREDSWRQAYVEECKRKSGETTTEEIVPLESVADAVDRANTEYSGQLVLAMNAKSEVRGSLFERPEEVFAALEFLATAYYEAKIGSKTCADLDGTLREFNGWKYLGQHSELTMKKYENWYTTKVGSKKHWLSEHLGTGTSKDPRRTIRIGFCWDDSSGKVIVGFIGQHQQTDKT